MVYRQWFIVMSVCSPSFIVCLSLCITLYIWLSTQRSCICSMLLLAVLRKLAAPFLSYLTDNVRNTNVKMHLDPPPFSNEPWTIYKPFMTESVHQISPSHAWRVQETTLKAMEIHHCYINRKVPGRNKNKLYTQRQTHLRKPWHGHILLHTIK